MCKQTDSPKKKLVSHRRKKLWEIDETYLCSILGTCLRRLDLHKFAKKKSFQMELGGNDYQIHSGLLGFAKTRNSQSRSMHKFLEARYRAAVKRYGAAPDDQHGLELWEQDLAKGSVAGAYWAIMTSRFFSTDMQTYVYGHTHMMSHDILGEYQKKQRLTQEIKNKSKVLEDVLVSERQVYLKEKTSMMNEIEKLKEMESKAINLKEKNKKLVEMNGSLKSELAGSSLSGKIEQLKDQLMESNNRNAGLCAEIETLKRELDDSRELLEAASNYSEEIVLKNVELEKNNTVLQKEVLSMETAMLGSMDASCNCSNCGDQNTNRCPGPDLCGRTILYVGGLHKMISHYKKLVESHGGKFLHHDGGKEASRAILPKMLNTADAVLCPIDCVSHDACTCVKKICKRYQKPYVMMRSSGLSSLAKGLTEIVQ